MPPVPEPAVETAVAEDHLQESSFTRSMRELAETLKKMALVSSSIPRTLSSSSQQNSNPKVIIHLMRHAEAVHNLAHLYGQNRADYKDPELTPRGFDQCRRVLATYPHMDDIDVVLCSPLRRTMQTALFSFQPMYVRGLKLIPWSSLREWGNGASNVGYSLEQMKKEMASLPVDLRLLNEGWELETDPRSEGAERSNRVRKELYALGEILLKGGIWKGIPMEQHAAPVHILVVSHGGFLMNVTFSEVCLYNTGYKSFCFASDKQIAKGVSRYRLFEIDEKAKTSQTSP